MGASGPNIETWAEFRDHLLDHSATLPLAGSIQMSSDYMQAIQ